MCSHYLLDHPRIYMKMWFNRSQLLRDVRMNDDYYMKTIVVFPKNDCILTSEKHTILRRNELPPVYTMFPAATVATFQTTVDETG